MTNITIAEKKAALEAAGCEFWGPEEYGAYGYIRMPDGLKLLWDWDDKNEAITKAYAHLQDRRKLEALRGLASALALAMFHLKETNQDLVDVLYFYEKLIKQYDNITADTDESDDDE